jgi:hypothetical protein
MGTGVGYPVDPFAWEWDGQTWSIVLQASPPSPAASPIAYDPILREVVYYGSQFQVYANCGDTWVYRTAMPATVTAYGYGCAGSAGTPDLSKAPYSLPWLGDTFRMQAAPLASTTPFALFALGLDSTAPVDLSPYGMPGCSALVAVACYSLATASGGSAELSMAVPNTTSLAGAHIFEQAFAVEPGANAAGVVVSNGADVLIGIR